MTYMEGKSQAKLSDLDRHGHFQPWEYSRNSGLQLFDALSAAFADRCFARKAWWFKVLAFWMVVVASPKGRAKGMT